MADQALNGYKAEMRLTGFRLLLLAALTTVIAVALFGSQSGPGNSAAAVKPSPDLTVIPPANTSPPAATAAAKPLPTVPSTPVPATRAETPIPLHIVEPLVTAPWLRFANWSPDGEWIAYWVSERGDDPVPGRLAFVSTRSGAVCGHDEVIAPDGWGGPVIWQADGSVIATPNDEALGGRPCETFAPLSGYIAPDALGDVSPDGRYRAHTASETEGQLIHNRTTITEIATGKEVASVTWDASIHHLRHGPRWLNNDLYLLGQTTYLLGQPKDQRVLYLSAAEGRTGSALTDLLGLDARYDEGFWNVYTTADYAAGEYHILLEWSNGSMESRLLLYHSELDQVEALPFYAALPFGAFASDAYGFSADGEWLLVGYPTRERPAGKIGEDYWLRPVDPPGSQAVQVAEGLGIGTLSSKTQRMAFIDGELIYLVSFPDGELLGRWSAPGHALQPMAWSPDGQRLAALGLLLSDPPLDALFVIQP